MSVKQRIIELRNPQLNADEEVRRGEEAARLLKNEVLQAAAAQVELDAIAAFFAADDPEVRDAERVKALAAELIFDALRAWAGDAEFQQAKRTG